MSRSRIAVGTMALGVVAVLAVAVSAANRPEAGRVTLLGEDLLSTTADPGTVSRAAERVHDDLANWVVEDAGKRSDPTYFSSSRQWKTGPEQAVVYSAWTLKFQDRQGQWVELTTRREAGRPAFIAIAYDGDKMKIANALTASLEAEGVVVAGR